MLTLRLPTLDGYLHVRQHPIQYQMEKESEEPLRGKDAMGRWRTAAAREYPQSMCVALARGIHDTLRENHGATGSSNTDVGDDEEFRLHLQQFLAFVVQHDRYQELQDEMCGDYNPCVQIGT